MRARLLLGTAGALALLASPERVDAQLVRVTETIYGMDCAPCAYGVERRLKRIDGVRDVTLSLNEGSADVVFEDRNTVTLDGIRTAIRRSGFSAEGGTVLVRGTVRRTDGELEVATPVGEVFVLTPLPTGLGAGTLIDVVGRVEKDPDPQGRWVLSANDIRPVAERNE